MKVCFAFLFFLLAFKQLSAYVVDTSQIRTHYQKALLWNEEKKTAQAATMAQQALSELKEIKNPPLDLEVGLHNILGDCALEAGNYIDAIKRYESAKDLIEKKGSKDGLLMAEVLNKLGNYYREIKEFGKAEGYLREALGIRKNILGNWNLKIADSYVNLGHCMNYIGDFDKALDFHQQALAIRTDLLPSFHPKIAQCYNNIGLCLDDKKEYDQALKAYHQAIEGYTVSYGKDHRDIADVYLNIGNIYGKLESIDTFIYYQTLALNIWLKTYEPDHPLIALAYNNLANAYDEQGNSEKAFQLFQKSLAIRISKYGEIHPDVAAIYFNMGLSYCWKENWSKAMETFQKCFRALNYKPGYLPTFQQVNDPILLLRLLQIVPEIPLHAYRESGEIGQLLEASSYFEQSDLLIDFLRTSYEAVGSKLMLANTAQDIYDTAIEITLALGELTNDKNYLRQAFQFSEKSKGILLLDALKKTEAGSFSGIPASTIAELKSIESDIGEMEKQRFLAWESKAEINNTLVDSLSNLIFQQKEALSKLIRNIEEKYPQYYNLRYATSTIPIDWLQENLLRPKQTIIEYFLGNNYLQIFVINKNDFNTKRIAITPEFRRALETINHSIRSFPYVSSTDLPKVIRQYASSANYLYTFLIAPIKTLIEETLIIIPDEELGFLSFETLLSSLPDSLSLFKTYPFLVKDYTISYNYSTGLFKEMVEHKNKKKLKPYLGFAPEFYDGNAKNLSNLKYNYEEVLGAKKSVGGQILFSHEATKSNFLQQQAVYKIIHLATHGKANNTAGDYSFLAFSENAEEQGDDALLYVREIYNLSTNAEMVVLSACETGTGELQKGEGIASIARSFSYAGAKSLIATQWSVDDKATSRLMHLFFDNIKRGLPKDLALRQAKLTFIETGSSKNIHPFFWASFIPIGNMEQLSFRSEWHSSGWFFGAFAALGFFYLLFIKFRTK
ncbi:MAG: CHAT domain-containing tetratricopeptide repeat protein [Saprospiraceae bacterium]